MSKFYKDLKAGLEEIIAYKEGKIKLRSTIVEIFESQATYKVKNKSKNKKPRLVRGFYHHLINFILPLIYQHRINQIINKLT